MLFGPDTWRQFVVASSRLGLIVAGPELAHFVSTHNNIVMQQYKMSTGDRGLARFFFREKSMPVPRRKARQVAASWFQDGLPAFSRADIPERSLDRSAPLQRRGVSAEVLT